MYEIAVLPGDGIGKDVMAQAIKALLKVGRRFGHSFQLTEYDVGGASIEKYGEPLTSEVISECKRSDAVLLGAVGGPTWDHLPLESRPEYGLLLLRKQLGCFANLRPIKHYPCLEKKTPLKRDILDRGVDLIVCRELMNGLYYGDRGFRTSTHGEREAFDTAVYSESAVRQIAHVAFRIARNRRRKVTSLDKSNILATSRLWRDIVTDVAAEYSDCTLEHQIIDTASMQIILNPSRYDVVLVNNEYGDIISEEASVLMTSHAMIPSASTGETGPSLFEPIHGSAPDIAGNDIANPIGAILTVALLLRHGFSLRTEAKALEAAVELALAHGYRTQDISTKGDSVVSTDEMGDRIIEYLADAA